MYSNQNIVNKQLFVSLNRNTWNLNLQAFQNNKKVFGMYERVKIESLKKK